MTAPAINRPRPAPAQLPGRCIALGFGAALPFKPSGASWVAFEVSKYDGAVPRFCVVHSRRPALGRLVTLSQARHLDRVPGCRGIFAAVAAVYSLPRLGLLSGLRSFRVPAGHDGVPAVLTVETVAADPDGLPAWCVGPVDL